MGDFDEYRISIALDPNVSGRSCQLDSLIDEECANEAYSLYASENPQSSSMKTATDSALYSSKVPY